MTTPKSLADACRAALREAFHDVDYENDFNPRRMIRIHEALCLAVDALDELNDILSDWEARAEIDSFTGQPARQALADLRACVRKDEE